MIICKTKVDTFLRRIIIATLFIIIICVFNNVAFAQNQNPDVNFSFASECFADSDKVITSCSLLNFDTTVENILVAESISNGNNLPWNSFSTWDPVILATVIQGAALDIIEVGTNIVIQRVTGPNAFAIRDAGDDLADLFNAISDQGPTEKIIGGNISIGFPGLSEISELADFVFPVSLFNFNVQQTIKFDAQIKDFADVNVNQDIVIEKLEIDPNASLNHSSQNNFVIRDSFNNIGTLVIDNGSQLNSNGNKFDNNGGIIKLDNGSNLTVDISNTNNPSTADNDGGEITADNGSRFTFTGPNFFNRENGLGNGLVQALNGSQVNFSGVQIDNTNGLIRAEGAGSLVTLGIGSEITGGTLAGNNGGIVRANAILGTGIQPVLDGVTTEGSVEIPIVRSVTIRNSLTNNGTWSVNGGNSGDAKIIFEGGATLGGPGDFNLSGLTARIETDNTVMVHEADHTIRGQGVILGGTGGMINRGRIIGDVTSRILGITANALGFTNDTTGTVQADGASRLVDLRGPVTNDNVIEAINGGELTVGDRSGGGSGVQVDNTNGLIRAEGAGSLVTLGIGSEITGGTLAGNNGGIVRANAILGTGIQPVLDGVTTEGSVEIPIVRSVTIRNSLTNNGTWSVNGGNSGDAKIIFEGGATLGGPGVSGILCSGHSDEKERSILWQSRRNYWTSCWKDVIRRRCSPRTACLTS